MGIFSKFGERLSKIGEKQAAKNKAEHTARVKQETQAAIQRLYHVDVTTLSDKEKAVLKKKIQDPIVCDIRNMLMKYKADKTLQAKVRHVITSYYGVDKELLSEVNGRMISFNDNRDEEYVEYSDCSQEIRGALADYVAGPIIQELEKKYKALVDGKIIRFSYGDGDEGIISYELLPW